MLTEESQVLIAIENMTGGEAPTLVHCGSTVTAHEAKRRDIELAEAPAARSIIGPERTLHGFLVFNER